MVMEEVHTIEICLSMFDGNIGRFHGRSSMCNESYINVPIQHDLCTSPGTQQSIARQLVQLAPLT